ncbi:MAG: hypothetical protein ACRD8U_18320 [Pyrinomonadaceae bacterium]
MNWFAPKLVGNLFTFDYNESAIGAVKSIETIDTGEEVECDSSCSLYYDESGKH